MRDKGFRINGIRFRDEKFINNFDSWDDVCSVGNVFGIYFDGFFLESGVFGVDSFLVFCFLSFSEVIVERRVFVLFWMCYGGIRNSTCVFLFLFYREVY